jgi:transcriptional regulator of acetoin/glycerol metabolism
VRELENIIEFLVVRTKDQTIRYDSLPANLKSSENIIQPLTEYTRENPSELIQLLEKHKWNKTKVAEELGIGRTTLWRILKNLNV